MPIPSSGSQNRRSFLVMGGWVGFMRLGLGPTFCLQHQPQFIPAFAHPSPTFPGRRSNPFHIATQKRLGPAPPGLSFFLGFSNTGCLLFCWGGQIRHRIDRVINNNPIF